MSKKCSQCGSVYTDQTLNFCLTDGSLLKNEDFGEKTLELPKEKIRETLDFQSNIRENPPETITELNLGDLRNTETKPKKNINRFWYFPAISLFAILLLGLGTLIGIYFFNNSPEKTLITITPKENSNVSNSSNVNSGRNQTILTQKNENLNISANENSDISSPTPKPATKTKTYRISGVSNNDVLYIRPSPGNLKVKVGSISPNGKGITITGKSKKVGKSFWVPINYQGKKGWVNRRHLKLDN